MAKEETLIRSILGPAANDIRSLSCALSVIMHLLFSENIPRDDILVTKHVYPKVARLTGKSPTAVSRQLERLGNLCWEQLGEEQKFMLIGRRIRDIRAPRDMLFYLAYYCQFDMPYYEILKRNPQILFGNGELPDPDSGVPDA